MEMKLHTILCVAVIQQLVKALNHLTIAWRVLHTIACVIKSRIIKSRGARARVIRDATMSGSPKSGSRWWAPPGCPAWMTKSEVEALWKPEDDLEGEFESQESATARRMLMNYFIFNPTEIDDWQEESDRASWYRCTTGSLTLLHVRDKVEQYKSATCAERGSGDWMDRLFAASWTSAVAAQAAQSESGPDDNLSGIDDDSPSVANGDGSPVQMEIDAVVPQAAQSGSEADDNLSGDDDDDEMDKAMGAAEHEQGTNVLPVSKGGASASSSAAAWSSFAHASAAASKGEAPASAAPSAAASNGKAPALTTATFKMQGNSIEPGKMASMMPAFQVGDFTNLDELLAASQKKARLTEALGQEIEVQLKPLFDTGIIIHEGLRQAWLGDKNGGNGGKCDSDDSNGVSNPEEATTEAVAASVVAAVIAAAVANVEAGNGDRKERLPTRLLLPPSHPPLPRLPPSHPPLPRPPPRRRPLP